MIRNNNSQLSQELRDVLKIQVGSDAIPALAEAKITPVVDVNPKHALIGTEIFYLNKTNSGAANIIVLDANKDFYMTGIALQLIKDATCDVADGQASISVTIGGASKFPAVIPTLTLTAQDSKYIANFQIPFKIDRGSTIAFSSATFTAGKMIRTAMIYGYYVDNIRA